MCYSLWPHLGVTPTYHLSSVSTDYISVHFKPQQNACKWTSCTLVLMFPLWNWHLEITLIFLCVVCNIWQWQVVCWNGGDGSLLLWLLLMSESSGVVWVIPPVLIVCRDIYLSPWSLETKVVPCWLKRKRTEVGELEALIENLKELPRHCTKWKALIQWYRILSSWQFLTINGMM